jgi:hypothetical protein
MTDNTLKIALYGKFGGRKTLQIGHLCDLVGAANVVILSADKGLATVASKIEHSNVITPTRFHPDGNALDFKKAYGMAKAVIDKLGPASWLAVDGGSEIHKWIKNEVFANCDAFYDAYVGGYPIPDGLKSYRRYFSKREGDLEMNGQNVYGKIGEISEQMLSALKALPCNWYMNYLEDLTSDNDRKKVPPYQPDVPGNMGLKAVMSTFDIVGRLTYGACKEHRECSELHLIGNFDNASGQYLARTRDDRDGGVRIPPAILDFNLGSFVAKIGTVSTQPAAVPATQAKGVKGAK